MPNSVFFAGLTHVGNFRKNNEDFVLAGPVAPNAKPSVGDVSGEMLTADGGCLLMVCDGLGGSTSGEVASELAARSLYHLLCQFQAAQPGADPCELLRAALLSAHEMVLDEARHNPVHDGMASTASSVWCLGERLIVGQVGDSRIYRFQNRTLKLVSQDQSPVGKLMLSGRITEAEAREHPMKNYVDEVLGGSRRVPKPQAEAFPLRDDDLFIICSDGLSDSLDDESIAHIVDKRLAEPVETIARELLDRALARAGHDNVSLIVVRAGSREGNRTTHRLARLFSSAPKVERTVIPPPGSDGAAS